MANEIQRDGGQNFEIIQWINADYYLSGEFGELGNDDGQFLLFVSYDGASEPHTMVAVVRDNEFCDGGGELLKHEWPDFEAIAVTELPVPDELLDRSMISRYDSKTAKDFYNA